MIYLIAAGPVIKKPIKNNGIIDKWYTVSYKSWNSCGMIEFVGFNSQTFYLSFPAFKFTRSVETSKESKENAAKIFA